MRITKVTTKKGDKGKTSLGTNEFVSKSSIDIQVLGDLDELSSVLGLVIVLYRGKELKSKIKDIQNDIFNLGGEISIGTECKDLLKVNRIRNLEEEIQLINKKLPPLREFILPGGNEISARIHHARAVCRRAERSLVMMMETKKI